MTSEFTKQIVVFRSGRLVQFQWACNALKEAGVPFFTREETSSGLRLAMPATPATGPGISWALLVPQPAVHDAQKILSELPFEVSTVAGVWDFQPSPKVKRGWRIYAIIVLIISAVILILDIIRAAR